MPNTDADDKKAKVEKKHARFRQIRKDMLERRIDRLTQRMESADFPPSASYSRMLSRLLAFRSNP